MISHTERQPCPGAAGRIESMNMYDRKLENNPGNTSGSRHVSPGPAIGSKGVSRFRRFLPILLLILLLPVSSAAENLTCGRLPMLMKSFLANHYAMKNVTGELMTHAVEQMTKSLDPSKTLLYESDLEKLKPVPPPDLCIMAVSFIVPNIDSMESSIDSTKHADNCCRSRPAFIKVGDFGRNSRFVIIA